MTLYIIYFFPQELPVQFIRIDSPYHKKYNLQHNCGYHQQLIQSINIEQLASNAPNYRIHHRRYQPFHCPVNKTVLIHQTITPPGSSKKCRTPVKLMLRQIIETHYVSIYIFFYACANITHGVSLHCLIFILIYHTLAAPIFLFIASLSQFKTTPYHPTSMFPPHQ